MTLEEQRNAGLKNKCLMLDYQNRSFVLNAGNSDVVEVFTQSIGLFVLTLNSYAEYVGLDSYVLSEAEPINTIFLQEYEVVELLGSKWKDMSTRTIAIKLMEYLI
jgi:hypothetical protein